MQQLKKIMLSHGGGGEEMQTLINETIFGIFDNEILRQNNDSAILNLTSGTLAFSTDSFVVSPVEFSGGNIGKLAACGTINDLAMVGAKAKFISCALILEEGLEVATLVRVLQSLKDECDKCGVLVVCGDTKVVPKGACDKIFINTSGVGEFFGAPVRTSGLKSGAKILVSGDVGRHGAVVVAARDELNLSSALKSDCKPLVGVVAALFEAGVRVLAMRDATRGGLSAVLNEWAMASGLTLRVREEAVRVSSEVSGVCELLGFEPFELANEGTFVLAVEAEDAEKAVAVLRRFDANANLIGEVLDVSSDTKFANLSSTKGKVLLETTYGGVRFLETPKGELLPRIC